MVGEPGSTEQTPVHIQDQVHGHRTAHGDGLDTAGHGVDVAEDFGSGHVKALLAQTTGSLCLQQAASAHFQSLDLR